MGRVAHNALHRELDPPPLVTPDLAFDIIEYLDETEPSNEIEAVRFYLEVEADNPMRPLAEQDYLQNIAEHLTRQLVFLEVGRYECLE